MNTVWYDYSKIQARNGTAVALGNFDGLHMGHMKLLTMLQNVSQDNGLQSVVYTFDKHPINVLKGAGTLKLIADNSYKQELLAACGLDALFFDDFKAVRELSPEAFVRDILVGKLNMKVAVVGQHNHYGKDSEGDVKLLRELGQKYGFLVYMIKPLYFGDFLCSSTKIRALIENGDVETAAELLARPFKLHSCAEKAMDPETTLGIPSITLAVSANQLLPKQGVYATTTYVDGEAFKSITSIDAANKIETYIIGYAGGAADSAEVEFLYKIRDQRAFTSLDELKNQLAEDKKVRLEK